MLPQSSCSDRTFYLDIQLPFSLIFPACFLAAWGYCTEEQESILHLMVISPESDDLFSSVKSTSDDTYFVTVPSALAACHRARSYSSKGKAGYTWDSTTGARVASCLKEPMLDSCHISRSAADCLFSSARLAQSWSGFWVSLA